MADTPRIKETVLRWLNGRGVGTFSIGTVAEECDLERRQVTTALHSLAEHGLTDQLERVGKGLWSFAPTQTISSTLPTGITAQNPEGTQFTYAWPDELLREVPVGWQSEFTVVSKQNINGRIEYNLLTKDGGLLRAIPVYTLEALTAPNEPPE